MKKIILLAVVVCTLQAKAQTSKDSLLNLMAKEACEDISKKDLTKVDPKKMEMEIGMMLMPTFMSHATEIEAIYGGGVTDPEAMKKMGMDLGMRLVQKCPAFMEFSMKMAGNKMDKKEAMAEVEPKSGDMEKGTLLAVNIGDITTITLKDSKGKITKLYWLEYFENADILKSNSKKYLGKKVQINYTQKSVYDAVKKDYKTIKVIEGVNLL